MKPRHHQVRPRVEALEERWVPAVTTALSARGVLTVTGDAGPNSIGVIDNGTNANGNIRVVADGDLRTFPTRTVAVVRVLAGDGFDSVTYRLTGDLQGGPRPRNIIVNLGGGGNSFAANVVGDIEAGADLNVFAFGLDGRDSLAWNGVGEVRAGATLQYQAFGLGGTDSLVATQSGRVNGTATFKMNGGSGFDSVGATFNVGFGNGGRLNANLGGQADNDVLRLFVFGAVSLGASVDGGGGFNTAITTGNVARINIQEGVVI